MSPPSHRYPLLNIKKSYTILFVKLLYNNYFKYIYIRFWKTLTCSNIVNLNNYNLNNHPKNIVCT